MCSGHHSMLTSQKSIGSTFTATTDQTRCGKRRVFCFSHPKPELPDTCNKMSLKEAERPRLAQSDVYELPTQRWQWALCRSVSSMIIFVSSHFQLIKALDCSVEV